MTDTDALAQTTKLAHGLGHYFMAKVYWKYCCRGNKVFILRLNRMTINGKRKKKRGLDRSQGQRM